MAIFIVFNGFPARPVSGIQAERLGGITAKGFRCVRLLAHPEGSVRVDALVRSGFPKLLRQP
jgi:hypothetical protein